MLVKKRFSFSKKTLIIASVVIVAAAASVTALSLANANKSTDKPTVSTDAPKYKTVLPANQSIDKLGGWTRISPPENDPVYAYTDSIGDISINVSEQPLPASFKGNVDTQVAELAKKFSATAQVTAGDTKVYIGTSAKGPQSVIFTKNNLLILIKSVQKIDDAAWTKYVTSLN